MCAARIDEFFYNQPSADFIDELKRDIHENKPLHFGERSIEPGEIDLRGMFLDIHFPDPSGLLETAYEDFARFLTVCDIAGSRFPVSIEQAETSCFEEHTLTLTPEGLRITANDTEGIRRALVYLENILTESEAAFLRPFTKTRRPTIKSRITRGFFSPTNRPPKNIDELWDDVDYYPDNYLNRIAHDGNNGIWIYTHFYDLIPSKIIPEYGKDAARRIQKLKKVVQKCARYGVKVYIFGVEPAGLSPELRDKYPEICGAGGAEYPCFCTHSEKGAAYCIEATQWLFTEVPELGGLIDITMGERVTNCSGADDYKQCPRCGKYLKGEVLSHTADLLREGMRRAGTGGELISWTYGHRAWDFADVRDYVRTAPDDVMLMQNFDDYGFHEQLGRSRYAMDYWLSYVGPSLLFEETAKTANQYHKHLYAKMQVCCSHEVATVPYIPVPALLFRKYAAANRYKVEGILQCWYFGNYPSIMSRAAGELSFTDDFSDEDGFLRHLAGICYGKNCADAVADAWKHFSAGYENYPLNIMFSYYGPMHDGVAWKLQLLPKNRPLSRTWQLLDPPDGDRISEALQLGHTLPEAVELSERICAEWERGLAILLHEAVGELSTLAKALGILFDSGKNILQFYQLREKLGSEDGDARVILAEMRVLVHAEMENSRAMIALCQADARLGYHSEAEGFKFFPEKLEQRIAYLEDLLATEFCTVEERITAGKVPLGFYAAEGERVYPLTDSLETASMESVGEKAAFRAAYDAENVYIDVFCDAGANIRFCFEGRLLWPCCEVYVRRGVPYLHPITAMYRPLIGDEIQRELAHYTITRTDHGYAITAPRAHIGWTEDRLPLRLMLRVNSDLWITEKDPVYTLGKGSFSAGEFGFLKICK